MVDFQPQMSRGLNIVRMGRKAARVIWQWCKAMISQTDPNRDNPMSDNSRCRTRLISDTPALEDAFGPHKRVATAIADLIRSEEGGKSIGLEGSWGSGKSTVINLLLAEMKKSEDSTAMVFDAWAHEGDPLRRTFLETLIKHLQQPPPQGWIEKIKWDNRREELARRRKVTTTKDVPQLTKLGKLVSITTPVIPLGLIIFSASLEDKKLGWYTVLGGILAVAPLIMALFWEMIGRRASQMFAGVSRSSGNRDEDPWALVVQKFTTETQTQTIENPDPTSVEFEDTFTKLMSEALETPSRRLVLILDNLDRVDPNLALSLWSTLQTFLQHGESRETAWFTRLWILIPYDPEGLRRLWRKDQSEQGHVAWSFLDKSFQIRFEVPPPVLSDWRKYLTTCLEEAFPDHDKSEFHAVYRLFALFRSKDRQSPTPRNLKLYVNQLGAIHRQWEHAFPLPHVAYYVLLRRDEQNIPEGLLLRKLPGPDVAGLLGEGVRDDLAALTFGVDVRLARQLLLQDPIAEALSQADVEGLKKLAQYPGGFWEVLEHAIPGSVTEWAKGEPAKLANAAYCLIESELLEVEGPPRSEVATITAALREAALEVKSWLPFDPNLAKGITSLCRLVPENDFARQLLNTISASPIGGETSGGDPAQASIWIDAMLVILKELRSLGLVNAYSQGVEVPTDPTGWMSACHRATTQDPQAELWSFLRPKVLASEIVTALVELLSTGSFAAQHVSTIRVLKAAKIETPWSDVAKASLTRLQAGNAVPAKELSLLLETLCELRSIDSTARSVLNTLATQGHLLHHLSQAFSQGNPSAIAWGLFIFLREVPNIVVPPAVGSATAGHQQLIQMVGAPGEELARKFVELLRRYGELPLLFKVLDEASAAKPLVALCLKQIAEGEDARGVFTPDVVMERWVFLHTEFDQDQRNGHEFDRFIARLTKETELVTQVHNTEFAPKQARLYMALVRAGAASDARFQSWCLRGLQAVNTAEWQSQLQQEGDLADLVIDLLKQGVEVTLTQAYQDALVAHGKATVAGQSTPSHLVSFWGELLKPLRTGSVRKMLRSGLYEAALNADGEINPVFFHLYGDEIADTEILRLDNRAVSHLFTPLLRNRNAEGLIWVAKFLPLHNQFLDGHPASHTVTDFKDRVRAAISNDPHDEASPTIQEIAKILQIEPTVKPTSTEQSDTTHPDNPNPETAQ